ncbi:alanine--tRNA ligase [Actinobacteria bacterium YIM 96077]|uniref:Alanine--tRNA ligase n=1 Tax=Phytoactinopolyspora halophila TaxID=1981511 RepID=A0A329QHR4_9ACTN|nr:alanine--tRNA ligase [Phytoactinopolyspora halophila]AYY13449.1 alanine--tRNA ligase [Actinobacteria bacterium YIM 96077]RAW10842.1 alanine--tRNA ligase [Phytoactinopolyspora halophila]
METAEIRRRFLDHFERNGHTVVPSASLISPDPSLLFTVAGMVPFIPYLTGQQAAPWPRATSVQKCIRTQDIDEVGKTTRHGTFFQMNGNFSFGDYFKEGAIEFAWDLITRSQDDGGYGFDPAKIWVTIYHDDDEAAALWKKVADLPEERIQRRGLIDNYWHTGQAGPGGPCSEIYVDRGPEYGPDGGPLVDEDRFLEIWNLVFMQEEITDVRAKDDFRVVGDLPSKNIDTGMGMERVSYLLQGVENMYEIDQVYPVIEHASELSGKRYGAEHDDDVRLRVVGDHVRSALMLIGDGVTPSNEGRGYVLRRLLRRSVRAMRLLGFDDPALPELLPVSRDAMKAAYPELESDFARISTIAYAEEDTFRKTLQTGTQIFDLAATETKQAGRATLAGDTAFKLHDTYGFPIDLTLEMAAEQGLAVDEEGFRRLMAEQRERAKADARAKKTGHGDMSAYRQLRDIGATPFTGYQELSTDTRIRGLVRDGVGVPAASEGEIVEVILDRTPFYAESGGQESDAGTITADGAELEVLDVQRPIKGLVVHRVRVVRGEITTGQEVLAVVDPEWRVGACQAHSGTHVVHAALREVLGPQALQSGSYNKPGYLRLDFSWGQALGPETRSEVEEAANLGIRRDLPVSATYMPLEKAQEIGALALFGETYDEEVRVVEMGGEWSRELCGGTHVAHSSQIGLVTLTGESSVGAGSRRVEGFVGIEGFRYLAKERTLVSQLADMLNVQPEQLPERVSRLVGQVRDAEKKLTQMQKSALGAKAAELAASARDVYGVWLVTHEMDEGSTADDLRSLVLDVRGRFGNERPAVAASAAAGPNGRPVIVVAANEEARRRGVTAGGLVKAAAQVLGGGGGGKDDVAQGGGTDASKIAEALGEVEHVVAETVTRGS